MKYKLTSQNLPLVLIFVSIVGFYLMSVYGLIDPVPFRNVASTITVVGNSMGQVNNQVATFNLGLNSRNANKDEAVADVTRRADDIVAIIREHGIKDEDMQTTSMSVYQLEEPYYEDGVQKYQKTDWNAYLSITVKFRDIDNVETFTQNLYALEVSDLNGPYFETAFGSENDEDLLKSALDDAHSKALALAKYNNKRLGDVMMITEGGAMPSPLMYEMRGAGGGGGVLPGSSDVSKTVTVTYELR